MLRSTHCRKFPCRPVYFVRTTLLQSIGTTWVSTQIYLAYGNMLRSTHCREFSYLKLCRPVYFVRTTQSHSIGATQVSPRGIYYTFQSSSPKTIVFCKIYIAGFTSIYLGPNSWRTGRCWRCPAAASTQFSWPRINRQMRQMYPPLICQTRWLIKILQWNDYEDINYLLLIIFPLKISFTSLYLTFKQSCLFTVCPRSSDPLYRVGY